MNDSIKIMLVDDEPIFLYHLKEIVQTCCGLLGCAADFVAECYDAEDALSQVDGADPDLVFTDIRMSEMDGLDFAQKLRKEKPRIKVVIVSGYPSFDYARTALRAQVADYLIKPIEPSAVTEVLKQTLRQLKAETYSKKRSRLQGYLEGEPELDPAFAGSLWPIAANCSDMHFNPLLYDSLLLNGSEHLDFLYPHLEPEEDVWVLPGADKQGLLFVFTLARYGRERSIELGRRLISRYSKPQAFTIVAVGHPVDDPTRLKDEAKKLARKLDNRQVIGRSILLPPDESDEPAPEAYASLSDAQEKTLEYKANKSDWPGIRDAVIRLFGEWEKQSCPSAFVEMNLRRIADAVGTETRRMHPLARRETESAIRELLSASSGFAEAGEAFADWLQSSAKTQDQPNGKKSEALFNRIQQFIAERLGEPLSLTALTEEFDISSTYLCNLFRIYRGSSFVEYFTELRINKAKELLNLRPEIPIKDIAEIVGYADRHYFSKVFKASVGLTPSEYRSPAPS